MPAQKTFFGTLARGLLTRLSRGRLPQTGGTLTMPGLSAPVEVIRDRWGIPHIYAENRPDLFFAQGFVHAQDRMFQMELNRRTAAGALSEIFGELSLNTDRFVRTFGFNRLGRADWENASPEIQETLTSYANGVSTFMDHPKRKWPLEFSLLGHIPDPWQPVDSAIFSRLMIWQMSHAWQSELVRAEIAEKVGMERAAELEIHYPAGNPMTLPKGIEFNKLDPDGKLRQLTGPFLDRGKGSNEWVIGSSRSETGHAVLANDMHLPLGIPSLWYQVHLNAPGYHVSGVSLPGLPMVLVGHNERIAWGTTLAFTDAEDLYVEQIDSQDPPRYLFKDEWHAAEIIEEEIEVKSTLAPFIERVVITNHGPVISDMVGNKEQKISIQSTDLQPTPALEGWYRLNQAQNWDDFVAAMRYIEAPQLNMAYADVEDNIGYWVTGKVPVRAKGDGTLPIPGWSGEYEWTGEVPFEEMPHAFNPECGYILNCNNKIINEAYPHFLGNIWMNGFRARRIKELIESREKLSMQDHQDFQMDVKCLPGLELVAKLEGAPDSDAKVRLALKLLRAWDGYLTAESVGGSVYEVARYTLIRELLVPGLGEELATRVMGNGYHPLLAKTQEFYGHDTTTLLRLLDDPDSWWVQEAGGREALIERGLQKTIDWLRENLGPDEAQWQWGKLHRITFTHSMSLRPPFDQVFDRGPFPIGGDTDTPLQTAMMPGDPYDNKAWAPSFRQIVDLGDLTKSQAVHPPGQSGHLASPHYEDLAQRWLSGEYHPMLWTREQVEAEAESTLILKSKNTD
jgi:penicillin amidase